MNRCAGRTGEDLAESQSDEAGAHPESSPTDCPIRCRGSRDDASAQATRHHIDHERKTHGPPVKQCAARDRCRLAIALLSPTSGAFAQASPGAGSPSVLPTGGGQALLDTSDTVFLLLDHQAGLFQTVKDISVAELRANTTMLAKLATLLKIPVITTASSPTVRTDR